LQREIVEGHLIKSKRVLLVPFFALLQVFAATGPSLAQSTEEPPKGREEVTILVVVEAGSPHGEIVSGVYGSSDHSGFSRYWEILKDELRDPRTGLELSKEVFKAAGEEVSKDIQITAEQSARILSKLVALGMSEESATRALEGVKRSLKRVAAEAPKGKAVAGVFISTASKAYIKYLVDNGMSSGETRANDQAIKPLRRPVSEPY